MGKRVLKEGARRCVTVKDRTIGEGFPVFIIAEIGASHQGNVELAARLIKEAAQCGVDAVKLQTVRAEESYVQGTESYRIFESLWLGQGELEMLQRVAGESGIILFSTPGDSLSLDIILRAGFPLIKVSSGLITNIPLIRKIAGTGLPVILSTGMSYLDEVGLALRVCEETGCENLMLLHCTSQYPAHPKDLNLLAMKTMSDAFPYPVGYSDHTVGSTAGIAACALGALLVEKHLVLDKSQPSPDSPFAADPAQLREFVREIRRVEQMLGSPYKRPSQEEDGKRELYRRCIVTRQPISAGQVLQEDSVALKRPRAGERGLPPLLLEQILGLRLRRDLDVDQVITLRDLCLGEKE